MAEAAIVSIEVYKNTLLAVGIDFYNIEAEAKGCEVRYHETKIIPGIVSHPLSSQEGIGCLFCVPIYSSRRPTLTSTRFATVERAIFEGRSKE